MMKNIFGMTVIFLLMVVSIAVSAFAQPTLPDIGAKTVNEGTLLQFTTTLAAGSDSGASVFTICSAGSATGTCTGSQTNGLSQITLGGTEANYSNISDSVAQFNWTPSTTASGNYYINFSVADADSTDSEIVAVTVNDVAPTLSVANLNLGGRNQDRSNPRHDDVRDREVNATGTITVTNSGTEQLTGLTATVSERLSFTTKDLNNKITIPPEGIVLDAGETTTVTIVMRVPEKLDAVDNKGIASAFNVADIVFTATRSQNSNTVSATSKVNMQAENMLEIDSAKIKFGTKSEKIDDGDTVDKVRPGDNVVLEFELENKFKDESDTLIEDIELTVENNDDLDIDESGDLNDINTEGKDTIEIEFDIDEDTPKGKEDLDILVLGDDENGAMHGEAWTVTLDIEREDHEIDVRLLTLNPQAVRCEEDTTLTVEIRNTGTRDEDETYIRVSSPDLGYSQVSEEINLDEDDEATRTFVIPVPSDVSLGNHRITVDTYYDTSKKSVSDAILVKKEACAKDVVTPPPVLPPPLTNNDPVVVITPPVVDQPPVDNPVVTPPVVEEEKGFFESSGFIVLLVLGYIVVLGAGAVIAVRLLRK